ncbi:hypothetical protein PINS_up006554 [Pythium insidiosum]|nr:hypothetical protein PINS_up006554 [Pythium insidiosum]
MKPVILPALALAAALALSHSQSDALRVETSDVAPPADIRGEHQELERVWSVYSDEPLEKLHFAVPGPVFVRYDSSLAHPVSAASETARVDGSSDKDANEDAAVAAGSLRGDGEDEALVAGSQDAEIESARHAHAHGSSSSSSDDDDDDVEEDAVIVAAGSLTQEQETGVGSTDAENDVVVGAADAGSFESGSFESELLANVTSNHARRLRSHKAQHATRESTASSSNKGEEVLVARVVVTGNSSDLLNMLELVALKKSSNNGLRVHFKNDDAKAEGFVLTQVALATPNVVRHVTTTLASVVDVAPRVLVTNNNETKVKLAVLGASGLLVTEHDALTLRDLDVEMSGSGFVQLNVSDVQLDGKLSASVAGSGAIAVHAPSVSASEIKASISGAGALIVEAENLTAHEIVTAVYGVGVSSVRATTSGATDKQKITIAGAGNVYAGSVVANRTSVEIWGSGRGVRAGHRQARRVDGVLGRRLLRRRQARRRAWRRLLFLALARVARGPRQV